MIYWPDLLYNFFFLFFSSCQGSNKSFSLSASHSFSLLAVSFYPRVDLFPAFATISSTDRRTVAILRHFSFFVEGERSFSSDASNCRLLRRRLKGGKESNRSDDVSLHLPVNPTPNRNSSPSVLPKSPFLFVLQRFFFFLCAPAPRTVRTRIRFRTINTRRRERER